MARRPKEKSDEAYRTISEVADILDVPQHVLRFWETKFKQLDPMKRAGGRRYYSPEDVDLLKKIHFLLYTKGYTIKGAQKLFSGKKNISAELVGISDHFKLITEPQPKEVVEISRTDVAEESSSDATEAVVDNSDNDSFVEKSTVTDSLKDILGALKELRSALNG